MACITITSNELYPSLSLGVRAEASIKELAAQVKLTQTYGNDATFPIEAKYSFPIPARASSEARETYKTAMAQGQQASLMEQQTPDVFQVAVGNIPSNQQVQIELVYVTELSEDEESDSIRFHLPVHIGARYGQAPQSIPSSFPRNVFISSSSPTPFLTLAMSVEAIAPISKIGCPSHSVSTELGPDPKLPNFKQFPFSNYARVSLSTDSPLDKDFVLTIKSAGLDAPRCVAELHPTQNTVAMGLTLVPRFKLPDLSRQEFVFMVDRSGSMRGMRIKAAQKALVIMLRALPHQDSLFQIVSFGSRTSSLWPHGSKSYNQQTLEEATRHIDRMQADYGGTEIRAALQHVFKARTRDRPMSVLVLTDGDTWDVDGVLSEVTSAVASAPKNAFLRVSVLGIGNSASTAMCEGMARVGNGICMMVGEEETIFTGKIARMLKAAKTPPISNISVDWGRSAASMSKEKTDNPPDYDDSELMEDANEKKKKKKRTTPVPLPPEVILPPVPPVQCAPFHIQNLFPNIRLNVYAILQGKAIPEIVVLRGSTFDGAEIELPIPVVLSHLETVSGAPPAVHTLAARKIIQDLEDGKHGLAKILANPNDQDLLARTVKGSIIRLGKTYSIASSHTSFVAIDDSQPRQTQFWMSHAAPLAAPDAFLMVPQSRPAYGLPHSFVARADHLGATSRQFKGSTARRSSSGFGSAAVQVMNNTMAAVGNAIRSSSTASASSSATNAAPPGDMPRGTRTSMRSASSASKESSFGHMRSRSHTGPASAAKAVSFTESYDPTIELYDPTIEYDPTVESYDPTNTFGASQEEYSVPRPRAAPSVASTATPCTVAAVVCQFLVRTWQFGGQEEYSGAPRRSAAVSPSARRGSLASAASTSSASYKRSDEFGAAPRSPTVSKSSAFDAAQPAGFTVYSVGSAAPRPSTGSSTPQFQQQSQQMRQAPTTDHRERSRKSADPLEALARLQSFDGCFSLQVLKVIKLKSDVETVRASLPAGVTDGIVATLLAMAFMSTKLAPKVDLDSWEGIYEKAQQYVEVALQKMGSAETAETLEAKVAKLLA
ncbi:hypothetical protein MVEN_01672100 [Mycena venus]|uniref:von Willebrand domain-containing protein n=1 Tax=Mycena venus TaxID=2733690 RepID=A0A8H7CP88_9AGAR|nr:hypothetical protein MVEN_01672100 [Mycena venus]